MENSNNLSRKMCIVLSLIVLGGCSKGVLPSSAEQSRTPAIGIDERKPDIQGNHNTVNVAVNVRMPRVIKGGEICENYLLEKIAKERAERSRLVKLHAFDTKRETLSSDLKRWLETRDETTLVEYELSQKEKKALILGSTNTKATGVASNFQNWFILLDGRSIEFLSLSENPELIYWDSDSILNYYVVTYSSQFLDQKDWENLTLDLLRYVITSDGESQLVGEERNVKCE